MVWREKDEVGVEWCGEGEVEGVEWCGEGEVEGVE